MRGASCYNAASTANRTVAKKYVPVVQSFGEASGIRNFAHLGKSHVGHVNPLRRRFGPLTKAPVTNSAFDRDLACADGLNMRITYSFSVNCNTMSFTSTICRTSYANISLISSQSRTSRQPKDRPTRYPRCHPQASKAINWEFDSSVIRLFIGGALLRGASVSYSSKWSSAHKSEATSLSKLPCSTVVIKHMFFGP